MLKAMLVERDEDIPRVHRLGDLIHRMDDTAMVALAPVQDEIDALDRF